jgi:hypothetical protein
MNSNENRNSEEHSNKGNPMRSKVGRLINEYGLEGFDDELIRLWTTDSNEQQSLRELADTFNLRLLRTRMEESEANPLEGEVENMYQLLTDDGVSAGSRTQAETRLERLGIDVDNLKQGFVSHQAIHTYLTKYRGVERSKSPNNPDTFENVLQSIQRLQNRLVAVVEKNLRTFKNTDRLTLGSFDVLVDVRIYCKDCDKQYNVRELLEDHGCECKVTQV